MKRWPLFFLVSAVGIICGYLLFHQSSPQSPRSEGSTPPSRPQIVPEYSPTQEALSSNPKTQPVVLLSTAEQREAADKLLKSSDQVSRVQLLRVYSTSNPDLRRIIESHAMSSDASLKTELIRLSSASIDLKNADATCAALEGLLHMAAPEAKPQALPLVTIANPTDIVERAISYLGRVNADEAFDAVHAIAMHATNVPLKAAAIRNLPLVGGLKHPESSVKVIEYALSDPSPAIRAEALRILGRYPNHVSPALMTKVEELSKSSNPDATGHDVVSESAKMVVVLLKAMPKPIRPQGLQ